MTRPIRLDADEVAQRAAEVPGWTCSDESLRRSLEFGSFVAAFGFMASVALIAERMDHHPNWSNVYGSVDIELTTHDVGGVSEFDFELAKAIDVLVDLES
jgi:4a-hydroxytetrahydrobiopterin dehydratase